jgi:hypothetical protein
MMRDGNEHCGRARQEYADKNFPPKFHVVIQANFAVKCIDKFEPDLERACISAGGNLKAKAPRTYQEY